MVEDQVALQTQRITLACKTTDRRAFSARLFSFDSGEDEDAHCIQANRHFKPTKAKNYPLVATGSQNRDPTSTLLLRVLRISYSMEPLSQNEAIFRWLQILPEFPRGKLAIPPKSPRCEAIVDHCALANSELNFSP